MNKHSIVAIVVGLVLVTGVYAVTQTTHAPSIDLEKEATVGFQGQIDPVEFKQKIEEGYIVLDVRTIDEYEAARISDDALLVDFYADDFLSQLAALDTNAPYVLHCRSGARSGKTVEILKDMGFTNFYELKGGIVSWQEEGLPVVSGVKDVSKQKTASPVNQNPAKIRPPTEDRVVCPADVMQCPDGSFIGRSGPDCKFVCL
jgi:rhodanese-related sulfurtransferase